MSLHVVCDNRHSVAIFTFFLVIAFVGLTLMLWLAAPAAAQNSGDMLREALATLDADWISTGRLYDRVLPLSGLRKLDGRFDAPPVAPIQFRQALDELRLSAVAAESWPRARPRGADLRERARALRATHAIAARPVIEIAIMDLAYQTIRPDALERGALLLSADSEHAGGRLDPAPGITAADLLTEHRAVAAMPLVQITHHGARTAVLLPGDLVIAEQPLQIAIDLDDGAGLRPLEPDQPARVRYETVGRKKIRLRLTTPSGTVRWTGFHLDVAALDTPSPSDVWPLTASIPYGGAAASGEAYIYLAEEHTAVTDPIVVVEGFDLDDSLGWPELYALLNQENLLEDLRAAGRDAVVLNFASATDPIQRNAFLLVELLQTLAAQLPSGKTYPIIGASMGGLVARYALTWLEDQGLSHSCDLLISFDVPHGGADIPLGLQHWVDFFAGESDEAAFLLSRLGTPAARQMLLYHHTATSGSTAAPDPLFAQFVTDLSALGSWPSQPRLVAVINGSGAGQDQGFAPGDQLIAYEYYSFLVDIIGNIWALPDGSSQVVFHGLIDLIWPLPDTQRIVTVAGTLPWDGAPGGYRASLAQLDTTGVTYGDIIALHDNHAFIPTVSSLALAGADPFLDLTEVADIPPFAAFYMPQVNEEHVAVTPASREWFLAEILGTATDVYPGALAALNAPLLAAALPNPFNPRTEITFALPHEGAVRLWIADVRGRRLRDLVTDRLGTGRHTAAWDGRDANGSNLASGVYLAVLEHAGQRLAKRLTLVR